MTIRYVGPGGDDANAGTSWILRKLTLNGVEDTPVVAGDVVYVGPGVYRETLTADVSGGNTYTTGTVSVTNAGTGVTGAGTSWSGSVVVGDRFQVVWFDTGVDGVTNGTATFTAAGGNFDSNMIGLTIEIEGKFAYHIGAVASAISLTLVDTNAEGWPSSGTGLTYHIMSGEGSYEINAVGGNTSITLSKPWAGPTLSGLSYITYRPITYVGDVAGENTDGIGGVVRITGSDNDTSQTRSNCVNNSSDDYRAYRGFTMDGSSSSLFYAWSCDYITVEDCVLVNGSVGDGIAFASVLYSTARRCFVACRMAQDKAISFTYTATHAVGNVAENCVIVNSYYGVDAIGAGGCTVRNCTFDVNQTAVRCSSLPAGAALSVYNCYLAGGWYGVFVTGAGGRILEDYNAFWGVTTNRTGCSAGANSISKAMARMPDMYLLSSPWRMPQAATGTPSEWATTATIELGGTYPRLEDFFGISRPAGKETAGAVQAYLPLRETDTTMNATRASISLPDACRHQIFVPAVAVSTTITVQVYRESQYTGTLPQMVIKQPGQDDRTTVDTGSSGTWNELSDTFTPGLSPGYVVVELVSNNTATGALNYQVFFDELTVS